MAGLSKKCRAAIIGLGRIASLLEDDGKREKPCTHSGAITANPCCVLSGGCDCDEDRRNLFEKRWNVPVYSSAEEMLRIQKPDILSIATHPDSHYRYCRLASSMNIPVVICEKPLADSLSSAEKIAALAKRSKTKIITNHERRYSADYIKAKSILTGGKLGTVLSVRAVIYMGKNKRLLDVLWHDGTHLADALMFLTDSLLKHRKHSGAKLSSASGTVWLEGELVKKGRRLPPVTENRTKKEWGAHRAIPVIIEAGAGRDHLVFETEFSCAKGRLRIGNGVFEVWESGESPYAENFRSLLKTDEKFEGATGYFANMISDAVSCVLEPERQPASSAQDGLAVIKYLHSVKAWN